MNVLLLSGGIESTCLAYQLRPNVCLTIDYGQQQAPGEIRASRNVATFLALPHHILEVNVRALGSGQMAGKAQIAEACIPEFWPYRNQLLVTLAAMKYVGVPQLQVIIGSTKNDFSHVDGRREFVECFSKALAMQEGGVTLLAPAIEFESIDLVRASKVHPDVLDMTFSCFRAEYPCGRCRGCLKNEELRARYYSEQPTCELD